VTATRRGFHHFAASLSQGLFGLVSIVVIIPKLSNTELGYIAALETLTYLFATVAGLNLDRAASRFYFNNESEEYRRNLFATLNLLSLVTIGVAALLVGIFGGALIRVFPSLPFWPLMVLALARVCFEIAGRIEQSYLIASGRSGLYAVGTIVSGFVLITLAFYLVVHLSYGVVGFLAAQVLAAVFLFVFLALASWKPRGWGKWESGILPPALSFAWPFIPTLIVAWIMSYYDRILVGRRFGLETLGVYGLSLRFAAPVLVVCGSITRAIYPSFYAVYGSADNRPSDRIAFARSVIYLFGGLGLGAMTMGRIVFGSVYGVRAEDALVYFVFIVVTYWISSVGFISSESLMLAKATKSNMVLGLWFAGASLGLNYLLIPSTGIKGAIAAAAVVALASFAAQLYLARRYVKIEMPPASYAYVLAVLLGTAVLAAWARAVWMDAALFILGATLLGPGVYKAVQFLRVRG
jgi:O-antigen/teichoic acid export membrane protein